MKNTFLKSVFGGTKNCRLISKNNFNNSMMLFDKIINKRFSNNKPFLNNKSFLKPNFFLHQKKPFCSKPTSSSVVQKTALNDYHRNTLKGKMVEFAGFDMPVQYPFGIIKEHMACRQQAAVFDVSHMGQVRVYGKDRVEFMESLCVGDLKELQRGMGTLTVFLNDKGGIIDDSIVTNMGDYVAIVFNAGRKLVDLENLNNQLKTEFKGKDIRIEHLTEQSLIAFQGPKAAAYLQNLVTGNLSNLGFMEQVFMDVPKLNEIIGVMRCGYTGEDGFEISVSNKNAIKLWELLYQENNTNGILPAGLGCRDSLRLEAGLCLYGHDLNEDITPVEGSLKWLIGKRRRKDGGFKGFKTIDAQLSGKNEVVKSRVGFTFTGGPPAREGSTIHTKEGTQIGVVTSGSMSPVLKTNIGMAYVNNSHSKVGNELLVKVRNNSYPIKISKMPFVPSNYYRKPK